ncbi:hypothetical protein QAD02_023910 [Eretmocerus hayati]|uniref:Uncharacterized protein n=1 Tax=Eretmocerus hayati TaxID=131215 RepID=A0ACC2PXI5_9HYME|nr:hypothetical protein QAD02_023910 [Eretmocerus hayati]
MRDFLRRLAKPALDWIKMSELVPQQSSTLLFAELPPVASSAHRLFLSELTLQKFFGVACPYVVTQMLSPDRLVCPSKSRTLGVWRPFEDNTTPHDNFHPKKKQKTQDHRMNEQLLQVVQNVDRENETVIDVMKHLLSAGADPDIVDSEKSTCLHYIALNWSENGETAELLISHGASPHIVDKDGDTPLIVASNSEYENFELVKKLIVAKADVNKKGGRGSTSLHHAAFHGKTDIVRILLLARASPDLVNDYGETPLMLATRSDHENFEVVEALIASGADVNKTDKRGCMSLHYAAKLGKATIVRTLLAAGALPDAIDEKNSSPLLLALSCDREIDEEKLDVVHQLIEAGTKINVADEWGMTPLLRACEHGNLELVDILLSKGACLTDSNKSGYNALLYATKSRNVELVSRLIKAGLDVNYVHVRGRESLFPSSTSALKIAVEGADTDMVKFLFAHGANTNLISETVSNLLGSALRSYHDTKTSIVKLLVSHGADVYATHVYTTKSFFESSVVRNDAPAARALLENGLNLDRYNPRTPYDLSPLHYAANHINGSDILSLLLEFNTKGSLNLEHMDESGQTPLHAAVIKRSVECVKILLESEASPNHADSQGLTNLELALVDRDIWYGPIKHVVQSKSIENTVILKLLLSYGADMYARWSISDRKSLFENLLREGKVTEMQIFLDYGLDLGRYNPLAPNDFSSLHVAVKHADSKILPFLLESDKKGSLNLEHEDEYGRSPLFIAVELNAIDHVKLLLNSGANANHADRIGCTPLEKVLLLHNSSAIHNGHTCIRLLVEAEANLRNVLAELLPDSSVDQISDTDGSGENARDQMARRALEKAKCIVKYRILFESRFQSIAEPVAHGNMGKSIKLKSYYEACKAEINIMKNSSLTDFTTFYDVLTAGNDFYKRVRNDQLYYTFSGEETYDRFPLFGMDFCENFLLMKQKHEIWEGAVRKMSQCLDLDSSGYYSVIRNILGHLGDNDLHSIANS